MENNYLEQIVFEGKVTKEGSFKSGDKEVAYTLTTLTHKDQQDIDDVMAGYDENSSNMQIAHTVILEILSRTLTKFGDTKFKNHEECKSFLLSRPSTFVKAMNLKQSALEKEVRDILSEGDLDENFSAPLDQD